MTVVGRRLQLDALRGIAAVLVVVHHWTEWGHGIGLGNIGVQLFFVLSGFLISGILFDQRRRLEAAETSYRQVALEFLVRRAARIWPLMFLVIGLVWLAGDRFERREDMLWHALFASNFLFFMRGEFGSFLSHFWSLAVEQQFYLVWPFMILLVPSKWLETIVITAIAVAPLTRLALVSQGYTHFAQFNVLPVANLDSLGLGALMAFWLRLPCEASSRRWRLYRIFSGVAAGGGIVLAGFAPDPANMAQTMYAVLFGAVIVAAHRGIGGIAGRLLKSKPLVAIGTISYGVYVYHVFAPRAVGAALRAVGAPDALHSGFLLFVLSAVLTLLVATISWRLLERPLVSLGRRATHSARSAYPLPN